MAMETLITWIVRIVAETLPEGTKIAEWATETVVKRFATASADSGIKAIGKLLKYLKDNPGNDGSEAFTALAADPSDPNAQRKLATALRKALERIDSADADAAIKAVAAMLEEGSLQLTRSIRGHVPRAPSRFLGRAADLKTLKLRLLNENQHHDPIILTGWPGVGKTTLTAALANDVDVASHFPDGIFWTSLDLSPHLITKMSEWERALNGEGILSIIDIDQANQRLDSLFQNKKALLIIDDAWDAADVRPLLVGGRDCRWLVSTRLGDVANDLAVSDRSLIRLPPLLPMDAVTLLRLLAGQANFSDASGLALVEALECLPLSLTVAGRLIGREHRNGMDVTALMHDLTQDARGILDSRAPVDRGQPNAASSSTVEMLIDKSVHRLPEDIQERFSFLGVMVPKPASFDMRAMQAIWKVDDARPTARTLVDAGLIEPLGGGRFQMHALLVDYTNAMLGD